MGLGWVWTHGEERPQPGAVLSFLGNEFHTASFTILEFVCRMLKFKPGKEGNEEGIGSRE